MKKLLFISFFLLFPALTIADDADLFTVRVDPDVLIILDTSGSMTFDMSGNYTWGDGSNDYPGRDTDANGYTDDSRMYIVKKALYQVVQKNRNIRFGLMTYGQYQATNEPSRGAGDGGGWYRDAPYNPQNTQNIPWHGVNSSYQDYWPRDYPDSQHDVLRVSMGLAGDPAHIGQIQGWIDNAQLVHELRADGGTPIGGALYYARQYYANQLIPQDPAKGCRKYFVLLVSDGKETGYPYYNPRSPYTEASNLRHTLSDGIEYDIQTYVCGVAVPGGEDAQCLDSIAKLGGTYNYYPATSPAGLDSAFEAMLYDIEQKAFTFAAPEVPPIKTKYYNYIYFASFMPSYSPFWNGYLKAYSLNPDGTFPQDSLGNPLNPYLWEAGEKLNEMSIYDRNVWTEKGSGLVKFNPYYVDSSDLDVPEDSVEPLINYVLGENNYDWKLGDIFHSSPVCVGAPSAYQDEGYAGFRKQHSHRNIVIICGANDGMLHAFDAGTYVALGDSFTGGTGGEVWAFIPNDLLPKLKYIQTAHSYYVDGSPVAFDAWFPEGPMDETKDSTEWKTVVICGERKGGNHYFALNITDTYNPVFLWDFGDTNLAQTWSTPGIGKVKIGNRDQWIAVFGGGKGTGTIGRAIYILNVTDGTIIRKFTATDAENMTNSFPSAPSLVDKNEDGFVDCIYIGDINGQLWKIDVSNETVDEWQIYRIFEAIGPTGRQPLYYPPACAFDKEGHLWLFFGGGDRDSVRSTSIKNRFYGLRDNGQTTPYTDANLVDVTLSGTANENGWYLTFVRNEKCISKAVVFGEIVYFTTYEPLETDDPCLALGKARLYRVVFTTGKAREGEERAEEIGEGLPASPQISVTAEGDFVVTIGASRGELISETVEIPEPFKKIIFWKEEKY